MATEKEAGALMKTAVAVATAIIVARIILEQLGAPEPINNIFGVAWLYLILPIPFALHILKERDPSPFKALTKNLFLFSLYTRLMVMVTYMFAYFLNWKAPRFSANMGGNVGNNVGPFKGVIVIPIRNAVIWILTATVVGMILGGITLWLKRKPSSQPPAA